jgi:hypothetical protein
LSITVKRIASRINIFADAYIYFAIAELATVKDADFDHGYRPFSWNEKRQSYLRQADEWIAIRLSAGCRWHEYLNPAPPYGVTDSSSKKYSVGKTPLVLGHNE